MLRTVGTSPLQRLILTSVACLLLAPAAARAAAPAATTGKATKVTDSTATLTGTVNPGGESTTYFFEYGPTNAYGAKTPERTVNGSAAKAVKGAISGLSAKTQYHFRLVATNPSGNQAGADKTFRTTKSYTPPPKGPNAVTCSAAPARVRYGSATTISGQLTGPDHAGVKVGFVEDPFPYDDAFTKIGDEVTTDGNGMYSGVLTPLVNTRYRAVAKAGPQVTCAPVTVLVRHAVTMRVSDRFVHRGQRVRFRGTVAPAHVGRRVRIQRRTRTGVFRTVARARLRAFGSTAVYGKRLRIFHKGTYRVKMSRDAEHVAGVSRRRTIRIG